MLAKVIKEPSAANFAPFFGAVGAKNPNDEGVSAFSFPELNDQDYSEGIISEDFITPSIEDVLQAGHQEHEQIVSQTKAHSAMAEESIRNQALQEARQMLEAENAAQIAQLRGQLTDTIAQISSLSDEIIQRVENDVVELALEIAKKIVAREVMFDREIALTLVKVSLKKLHSRAVAEVRLHPEDFAYVQAHRGKIDFHGSLDIVEDRTITLGGCLIHTETGDIDARIESQFEEVAHGLLGR